MADLSCGMNCVKYIFFVINVLFFLLGLGIVAGTIVVLVDDKDSILSELLKKGDIDASADDLSNTIRTACIVFIVAGAVVVVVAFLGCCGAIREAKVLIGLYMFFVILIIILELAAVIVAIVFVVWAPDNMKSLLKSRIMKEYTGKSPASNSFTDAINGAQVWLECCGIDSYTDYDNATNWARNSTIMIPLTCCVLKAPDDYYGKPSEAVAKFATCQTNPSDANSYYKKGCADALMDKVKRNAWLVGGLGFAILFIQFLCIAFSCCLCRSYGDTKA